MTNEERDLITRFVERVGGAQAPAAGQGAVAPLPPVDSEADRLIAELFNRYPEARYRVTQLAFVSEHALVEAQNRIARLQWEVQQARQAQAAPPPGAQWGSGAQPQQPRGFFSSLFGGGGQTVPPQGQPQYPPQYSGPPPQPQYPPGYAQGAFQQQGPGFLGSALRTAAGVAGGVVAADALMSLFSGNRGGGGFGGGFGGGPEVVEYVNVAAPSPWGAPAVDPYDVGGAPKAEPGYAPQVDQSPWSPAPDQTAGADWRDTQPDQGGGWDQASGDDSSGGSDWQDS